MEKNVVERDIRNASIDGGSDNDIADNKDNPGLADYIMNPENVQENSSEVNVDDDDRVDNDSSDNEERFEIDNEAANNDIEENMHFDQQNRQVGTVHGHSAICGQQLSVQGDLPL
ncbi:uncharacterized protein LOC116853741 [Odontomachus brunneus]|uniref:uncharacterized protein LOC116853741 n=1 Tax=Odontomachus brunneus TaxID=486640 RepID=UPI0013F208FE|nr:uncharacterized protein LOC116853741 [Odontomachus brunneus]